MRLQGLDDVADRIVEIDALGERQVLAHLHPRQRQQVVDQPGHALGLLAHDLEEALARLRVVLGGALQRLDEAPQRGERGPELVAGVGDEIGAHAGEPVLLAQVAKRDEERRAARPGRSRSSGATVASRRRSTGTRSCSSTQAASPETSAWSTAASSSGSRLMEATWLPRRRAAEQVLGQAIGVHDIAGIVEHDGRLRHGIDHHVPHLVAAQVGLTGSAAAQRACLVVGRPQRGPCGDSDQTERGPRAPTVRQRS